MIDLLKTEKQFISTHIKEGGTVVDFTMGNGHDTLWLSRAVGENGKVYALFYVLLSIFAFSRLEKSCKSWQASKHI